VASDGSVYVADMRNNRIQKFTSDGKFVRKWGTVGTGDGEFNEPHGVAVASDGSVYVADTFNNRIQKFTSDGVFVSKWGSYGAEAGQFRYPHDLSVAPDGSVYVAPHIQKFTSEGEFVAKLDQRAFSVTVASDGSVYLSTFVKIHKYTSRGEFVVSWGSHGRGDGQFGLKPHVTVAPDGSLYVSDSQTHRIQKFTSAGQFISKWDDVVKGDLPPGLPAVAPDGSVYVSDQRNHQIQKFAGSPSSFTVNLASEPSGDVTVTVGSKNTEEVTVSPDTLTFTTAAWDVPQVVILRGVPDGDVDGDQETIVTVSVDAGASAEEYKSVSPQDIRVTTTDVD